MKHRILCCTRPGTGSRDSHTCVTSYTYHFWNICGNLKIALGVNPFVSNGEPRLNVPSLLEPKSDTFSHRVITAISKTGKSEWKNLVNLGWLWQCNFFGMYINCYYFCVRVRPKKFLSLSLSFFFFHCSPMTIRPGQAEKNEKASSLYRLRQSTIAEKMKRCVP